MRSLEWFPLGTNNVPFVQRQPGEEEEEDDSDDDNANQQQPGIRDLHTQLFVCRVCRAHVASGREIYSRDFYGSTGRAYLFNFCLNTEESVAEERRLRTGMHTVADTACWQCGQALGWKYLAAADATQRYKVGKHVVELAHVLRVNNGRNPPNFHFNAATPSNTSSSNEEEEEA